MSNASVRLNKKPIVAALFLLITAALLVACADTPTDTPAAAPASTTAAANGSATTAAATNGTAAAGANPTNGAAGNPANGAPGANRGQFNVVNGTVASYDATAKSLTVKAADGTSQTFDATNASISKNQKISIADLGKLTLSSEIVQVTGEKAADGTYSATALLLADQNMFGGNGAFPGANGTPGAGRGNGAFNGTPGAGRGNGANGTPGAGRGANGTPGAGFGGGFGGPNGAANGNRLMVRNATVSGNTLTGTDMTGAAVTVNLTDSTQITHRVADTATDLAAGQKISVNFRAGQNNAANTAVAITIEQ